MSPETMVRMNEDFIAVDFGVPDGLEAKVMPSVGFADALRIDPAFTGAPSFGNFAPYRSQMESMRQAGMLYTHDVAPPLQRRVVLVSILMVPWSATPSLASALVREQPAVEPAAIGEPAIELARATPSLADVTEQMRRLVDLPVQDLARMCGLGRRQYYNLLRGKAEATKTSRAEQQIRLLHTCLQDLNDALGGHSAKVRSALLMPLDACGRGSFAEVASGGDVDATRRAYEALRSALPAPGDLPERLPPSGTFAPDDETWQDAAAFMNADAPSG